MADRVVKWAKTIRITVLTISLRNTYSGSPFEIGSARNTWKLAYLCTNSFLRKCLYQNFFNFGMKWVNLNEIYYTNFYLKKCSLANLLISHKIVILNACANNFLEKISILCHLKAQETVIRELFTPLHLMSNGTKCAPLFLWETRNSGAHFVPSDTQSRSPKGQKPNHLPLNLGLVTELHCQLRVIDLSPGQSTL